MKDFVHGDLFGQNVRRPKTYKEYTTIVIGRLDDFLRALRHLN